MQKSLLNLMLKMIHTGAEQKEANQMSFTIHRSGLLGYWGALS